MDIIYKLKRISITKTMIFNYHYFGLKSLLTPYVYVGKKTRFASLKGSVEIKNKRRGCILIGYTDNGFQFEESVWNNKGTVIFEGSATFSQGIKICNTGSLVFGDGVLINGNTTFLCVENIAVGKNTNISWDCMFMDSDFHTITSKETIINKNAPLCIGDNVLIGCKSTVLKGVSIADNVVVASNSLITKSILNKNVIASGMRILKENVSWTMPIPYSDCKER